MDANTIKAFLIYNILINYLILIIWFLVFVYAHDWLFRIHRKWFRLSIETFDKLNYISIAIYKIIVIAFNIVPLIALFLFH